ncbi:MAG TPA: prephenate dehydrogenase/arogenate dehydrogenase family protein [Solirubrobacterales bacterium]|jgi:prephenate dehydrogenase|nr:prephenate dehydrogenase/arogenate dehydrogenase family protein [Solirubrobacterales bacterium]
MRIAVLGVGLIGGSIGLAARDRLAAEVAGYDPDAKLLARAGELSAVGSTHDSIADAVAGAEIVFCAAPVGVLRDVARDALTAAGKDTAVTDVGSVKRDAIAALGSDPRFVGGHPLAGAETAGVENARADLFDGARWYLTPTPRTGGLLYDRVQRAIAGMGARPQAIDAQAHDRLMATVSHLPHVLANVLVAQAADALTGDYSERIPEVGPSFRDAARVAGANPAIWGDILAGNREAVADQVEAAAARLSDAAELLRSGDPDSIAAWHSGAADHRRGLLAEDRAGGRLRELRVLVPNTPGVVAQIALALGDGGVNIEDMALHPSADMRSGAISLFVAGDDDARRAADLIGALGHDVVPVER